MPTDPLDPDPTVAAPSPADDLTRSHVHETAPPAEPALPPPPPGYDLLGVLGRGGMGVVYKARQRALNREVALKVLLAGGHASEAQRARFLAEAGAVAAVNHPGVVQVHDFGTWDGQPFLALEFCPAGTLADRLSGTPLPPRDAAALVEQLAAAVVAAHAKGIVHRDLKPANVLLAADGSPKVTDFGLAKMTGSEEGLTATGAVLGTPSYMAPEQARGDAKNVGPAADTYALGAVLYECLTGRPPFKGSTPADTLLQVLDQEPVAVRALNPQVPADLETVCHKCLEKNPAKRYASAEALAGDLRAFLDGRSVTARPVGPAGRLVRVCRRNPTVSALVAGVAVLLVVGGVTAWVLAVQASRDAAAARAALEERDRAVERERAVAREFVRHLARQSNLTRRQKVEVVESFCREHPEYSLEELVAGLGGEPEPLPAVANQPATFAQQFLGD
jgi:serine/threonine-protein kinase